MSELWQRGVIAVDGPFSFNEITEIASDYDHSLAVTPDAQIKRGRTSTRWGGLIALKPFYRIYLYAPLLTAASERIGGLMKLSSFHARTLFSNVAAEPPHQDVAPGANGYPLVGFIFMVDEFRFENGATRFMAGSQNGPRPSAGAVACDACGRAGSMLIFDGTTCIDTAQTALTAHAAPFKVPSFRGTHKAARCWADEVSLAQANGLPADARRLLSV